MVLVRVFDTVLTKILTGLCLAASTPAVPPLLLLGENAQ